MSVFPVFKIIKMLRSPENDMTDFIFLGQKYRLIARPIKYWKYFPRSRKFYSRVEEGYVNEPPYDWDYK